jgi:hypothetical protein
LRKGGKQGWPESVLAIADLEDIAKYIKESRVQRLLVPICCPLDEVATEEDQKEGKMNG